MVEIRPPHFEKVFWEILAGHPAPEQLSPASLVPKTSGLGAEVQILTPGDRNRLPLAGR